MQSGETVVPVTNQLRSLELRDADNLKGFDTSMITPNAPIELEELVLLGGYETSTKLRRLLGACILPHLKTLVISDAS